MCTPMVKVNLSLIDGSFIGYASVHYIIHGFLLHLKYINSIKSIDKTMV